MHCVILIAAVLRDHNESATVVHLATPNISSSNLSLRPWQCFNRISSSTWPFQAHCSRSPYKLTLTGYRGTCRKMPTLQMHCSPPIARVGGRASESYRNTFRDDTGHTTISYKTSTAFSEDKALIFSYCSCSFVSTSMISPAPPTYKR